MRAVFDEIVVVVGACVVAVALAWPAPAAAGMLPGDRTVSEKVHLLDVPFVPQSETLCGGAALAMVLRYWGKSGVLADSFAALVEPEHDGILTGALVKAVEAYGWIALPLAGTSVEVQSHLARGRPVIALIQPSTNSYHYVVLVAWANGCVIIHDPNAGPFRAIREEEFDAAWSTTRSWALLVLPPQETKEQGALNLTAPNRSPPCATSVCDAMVEAGILLAQRGDTGKAELKFLAAQSMFPASAAPLRERAGLRFRSEDWADASRLAEHALVLDPSDAHTWRLLAASRYLDGDLDGALCAWNHISEPRADLTHIDGLTRTRFSVVADQLDLPPGRLLTPQAFRQARRRLAEMPAQLDSRLILRPLAEGNAQVNVALLERPPVLDGLWDVANASIKALTEREISFDIASPTGNGELWSAGWRWWKDRPRVSLALTVPAGGRPGVWRLEGFWERQAYAVRTFSGSSETIGARIIREERRRTALSFSDWLGPDFRLEIGAALDKWIDRGSYLSLEASVDTRWACDRLAAGAQAAEWINLASGALFGVGGLSLKWSSNGFERCDEWLGCLEVSGTTTEAPLALWSGAGTGYGRDPLLRAHPMLNGGIVEGRVFGRSLVHGTIERLAWPWEVGPLRVGWALFIDWAKSWETGRKDRIPYQVDGGMGLRLRSMGMKGLLRIDVARGFEDGNSAVSIGWQVP